jgi:uncharacterized SAM-binding protein YcdF (DUF218 family)
MRLVVVLGYSDRRGRDLHPICSARLEAAASATRGDDAVLLSGKPEARVMRAAWTGSAEQVLVDLEARNTAESAVQTARLVRELGADEVVVVTSWWHRRRAGLLFNILLRGSGARVSTIPAPTWTTRLLMRELGALALVPVQLRRVRA